MTLMQQQGTTISLEHWEVRFVKATQYHITLVPFATELLQKTTILSLFHSPIPVRYSLPLQTTMLSVEAARSYQMARSIIKSQPLLSTIECFPLCWFQDTSVSSLSSYFGSPTSLADVSCSLLSPTSQCWADPMLNS